MLPLVKNSFDGNPDKISWFSLGSVAYFL